MENISSTETVIIEWDEPVHDLISNGTTGKAQVIAGGIGLGLLLAGAGYVLKDSTFYFAAAAAALAGFAFSSQQKHSSAKRHIQLTSSRILIGAQVYPLSELAGFWLEHDKDQVLVNIERSKASFLPITLVAPNIPSETLKQQLLQVLAEVEPRPGAIFNQLFRR